MSIRATRSLANISVKSKLTLGFGVVLALTLVITITGWASLNSLISRGEKIAAITQLSDSTRDLRIARVSYEANRGAKGSGEVLAEMDKLDAAIVGAKRLLVVPSDTVLLDKQVAAAADYRSAFAALDSAVRARGMGSSNQFDDPAELAALKRMQDAGTQLLDNSMALDQSQDAKRDADTKSSKELLALAASLALLLGIFAAWLITRQIVAPLRQALIAVDRVASGDLTHDIDVHRRDELGQLQQSMQRMTVALRGLVGGISDGVTQIASAAEELSAVTEQTSAGVSSQKVETDQLATAMNEMAATVHEVARNAEQASEAAVAADQQAREGDRVVNQAIAQIERLASEVGNSSQAVNDLKLESDKIGGILDVIKSVAEQTNLLALNAAIEAARAGEAGRGFAVVADEVRSLAQRTQTSTKEIEALISALQNGTDQVTRAMGSSLELTGSSVELTRKAGVELKNITQTVSAIQSMNQQIATAAEQQSAVAEEINRSVINVRDVSEQTSAASEETAASSIELARLGTHLQGLVGQFRV
jgi:methyl-accepting chemotaxis protein